MAKTKYNIFKTPKIDKSMHRPDGAGNYENMDDYNIVNTVNVKQGSIQDTPQQPKDIVNKEYLDDQLLIVCQLDEAYNVELTDADTEYSQTFTAGTKYLRIKQRSDYDVDPLIPDVAIRYAYETGKVAAKTAPYFTIGPGETYEIRNLNLEDGGTIYLASPVAGVTVEIEEWI